MSQFALIALDVDGTLINDDHELTRQNKETIQKVAKLGAEIILCTGRSPNSTLPLMEELELSGVLITHNGSVTLTSDSRKILHQFIIPRELLAPYRQYCIEHGYHYDLNTAFNLYVESQELLTPDTLEMYEKFYIDPLILPMDDAIHNEVVKMTIAGSKEQLDALEATWSTWEHELTIIRSGDFFIDIMHPDASKGNALKALASKREVDASQVLAIGNYYNDITMLQFAGVGVAMDNSPIEVKGAADDITLSNNEHGVHYALEKYCL